MEGEDIGSGGWLALRLGHLESLEFGAVEATPGLQ